MLKGFVQIVSGIGFLGAGAIIKEGWNIIGLTSKSILIISCDRKTLIETQLLRACGFVLR